MKGSFLLPEEKFDVQNPEMDIDDFLSLFPFNRYFKLSISILGLGLMAEGIEPALIAILNVIYHDKFGIPKSQVALLTSCIFLGLFFGCLTSGYFSDRFGRKRCIYTCDICLFFPSILSAFIINIYGIIIMRTIAMFCWNCLSYSF